MTVPTPYGLPNGALFVENFNSPATVAANGGVVTGTGLANGRFTPSASSQITYPSKVGMLFRLPKLTICTVFRYSAFTGTTRSLFRVENTVAGGRYTIALANASDTVAWSGTGTVLSSAITPGKRSLVVAFDGAAVAFYIDGVAAGSGADTLNAVAQVNMNATIGLAAQPLNEPIRTLKVYSTAFTAADALDWHRSSLRYI